MESLNVKFKLSDNLLITIKTNVENLNNKLQTKFNKVENGIFTYEFLHELHQALREQPSNLDEFKYFHEWIENSIILYPTIPVPKRSAEYEARIEKLKKQQAQRDYNKMTCNVDNKTLKESYGPVMPEIRILRSQLFAVINFVLTVGGTFVFGYKAMEYSLPSPVVPAQVMTGMILATIVAVAELYFLAKII